MSLRQALAIGALGVGWAGFACTGTSSPASAGGRASASATLASAAHTSATSTVATTGGAPTGSGRGAGAGGVAGTGMSTVATTTTGAGGGGNCPAGYCTSAADCCTGQCCDGLQTCSPQGSAECSSTFDAGTCAADAGPAPAAEYVSWWSAVKVDTANNRCIAVSIGPATGSTSYGIAASKGWGLVEVSMTNSANDCFGNSPSTQFVHASGGVGTLSVTLCGALCPTCKPNAQSFDLCATFEFPSTYPWVPGSDTFFGTALGAMDGQLCM